MSVIPWPYRLLALAVLDDLGLRETIDGRYLRKHGVAVRCARTGRQQRFRYDEAFEPGPALAWQVPRADFDDVLLRCARSHGAEVLEGHAAEDVVFEDGSARGVIARREDGRQQAFHARLIVDATGQDALLAVLPTLPGRIVLVANEVGLGLVPETPLGRLFRDEAGRLNQMVASACRRVVFVAAGLPLVLKEG